MSSVTPRRPGETLSVVMIVRDGERLLDEVLSSVGWADEIVIVDSGSTDGTEAIARRHTVNFHSLPYRGHGVMRQEAYSRSTGDWILYIDSDEVVTPDLAASIQHSIEQPGDFSAFRMKLETKFLESWFGSRGWRREWKTRLFHRDAGRFDARPIHEGAVIQGKVGTLDGILLHYPYRDLAHARAKLAGYAEQGADLLRDQGRRSTRAGAALRGVIRFLRDYLLGGDFLYGRAGFIRSAIMGEYTYRKHRRAGQR